MILFAGLGGAHAFDTPVSSLQSPQVKSQTVQALKAIDRGQWDKGRDIVAGTRDPLASKLYYWLLFTRKGDQQNYTHLAQFIRSNPHWPGISGLKSRAEKSMPRDLTPQEVIAWFDDYEPASAQGMDRYVEALIYGGKTAQAKKTLSDWWAKTTLPREDQRQIYKKYGNLIDKAAHRRRFDTLLFAGQYTNARAIAGVLGAGYLELAEARIALAEQKGDVNGVISRVPKSLQSDPGLLYERLRWRRRHNLDVEAMEILHNAPSAEKINNPKDWWQERHIIIRRLIEKKHYESAYLLARKHVQKDGFPKLQAEWVSGWLALRFLDKPALAYQHFEVLYALAETPISQGRGAYWAGRAAGALGQKDLEKQWYEKAAKYQTVFYGQMAGAELGMASALPNAAPPNLSAAEKADFERREMIQASRVLHDAGLRSEASRFLQAFVNDVETPEAYRFAADIALEIDQQHDAVRIAKEATKKGLFLTAQSYPVITKSLGGIKTEWALVHALIRQESMFDINALSHAGARGLMQLMPGTAKDTARKIGISHQTDWLTSNPAHNIRLGTTYLDQMLARFGGSYPLAIAAYNAGPGRVDQWLKTFGDPRTGEIDLIDWMELIPIYETRNYVQRVMESVYVYRLRLKGVQKQPVSAIHIAMGE